MDVGEEFKKWIKESQAHNPVFETGWTLEGMRNAYNFGLSIGRKAENEEIRQYIEGRGTVTVTFYSLNSSTTEEVYYINEDDLEAIRQRIEEGK